MVIFYLQSVTKYLANSKKIKQNWTRPEKFDICFCISFDCYFQKVVFGGETDRQPVSPCYFEIFVDFLTPKILSRSATLDATHMQKLLYQISNSVLLMANQTCTEKQ